MTHPMKCVHTKSIDELVVSHTLGIVIPTDEFILFREILSTTNQICFISHISIDYPYTNHIYKPFFMDIFLPLGPAGLIFLSPLGGAQGPARDHAAADRWDARFCPGTWRVWRGGTDHANSLWRLWFKSLGSCFC